MKVRGMEWWESARCAGWNTDVFLRAGARPASPEQKALCAPCPVRAECLEDALVTGATHYVRGGLSPFEIKRMTGDVVLEAKKRGGAEC